MFNKLMKNKERVITFEVTILFILFWLRAGC